MSNKAIAVNKITNWLQVTRDSLSRQEAKEEFLMRSCVWRLIQLLLLHWFMLPIFLTVFFNSPIEDLFASHHPWPERVFPWKTLDSSKRLVIKLIQGYDNSFVRNKCLRHWCGIFINVVINFILDVWLLYILRRQQQRVFETDI